MDHQDKTLHAIIFVSSVTEEVDEKTATALITTEKEYSRDHDLTGIILVCGGNVLRLIEGEMEEVQKEYQRTQKNYYHHSMIKVFDQPTAHRYFESLVFMTTNHNQEALNDYHTSDEKAFLDECLKIDSKEMRIIKDFLKNNT